MKALVGGPSPLDNLSLKLYSAAFSAAGVGGTAGALSVMTSLRPATGSGSSVCWDLGRFAGF